MEYKFRGMSLTDNDMVYGSLLVEHDHEDHKEDSHGHSQTAETWDLYSILCDISNKWHDIDFETIGFCSSREDKFGKQIHAGDILKRYKKSGKSYMNLKEVTWNGLKFGGLDFASESEVVGNIFQNPDLLKTKP